MANESFLRQRCVGNVDIARLLEDPNVLRQAAYQSSDKVQACSVQGAVLDF
ncbi:hypothetical protein DSUL_20562 [Desulfovibrionales bacterium]